MGVVKIHLPDNWHPQSSLNVTAAFQSLLAGNQDILTQLHNYHSDEDGSPNVLEFAVDNVNFDTSTDTGKIRFAYRVEFHFGCSDLSPSTHNIETSNFIINPREKILSISIHDKISRDTYEEF